MIKLSLRNSIVIPSEPVVKRLEAEPELHPEGEDPVTVKLATLFEEV